MWRLALRNLFRNGRRTVITLMAIGFGMAMVHLNTTLQTGSYADMIHSGTADISGHVSVQRKGFDDSEEDDVVEGAGALVEKLRGGLRGAVVAPRLNLGGLLVSPRNSVGVGLQGLEGPIEAPLRRVDDQIVDGTWLDGDARGIVIGRKLAEALQVKIGDKIVYMGQHGGATEVTSRLFRVKGIFASGAPELDAFVAFAELSAVQECYGKPDVAHRITVHLDDPARTLDATNEAATILGITPELEVLDWKRALPELWGVIQVDRRSGDLIMMLLGGIVAMGALNTVLMSALERTREFGVLLALGMRPWQLSRLILGEGLLLGIFGVLAGLGIGYVLCWPLVTYGLDYTAYVGDSFETAGVVVPGVIMGRWDPGRMANYSVIGVVFTVLATLYPAWHVSRLQPVQAMRHV